MPVTATSSNVSLRDQVKEAVSKGKPSVLAADLVLERIPHLFEGKWDTYREWRANLAAKN